MSRICPTCSESLNASTGGRPRRYCSTACKRAAEYERQRLDREIAHTRRELLKARVTEATHATRGSKAAVRVIEESLAASELRLLELLRAEESPESRTTSE